MLTSIHLHLLCIGLFSAVNCATDVSNTSFPTAPPDFNLIVAPTTATPGNTITVHVHVEDTPPRAQRQSVSVLLMHSSNGLVARNGPRTILSGSYNVFLLAISDADYSAVGQYSLVVQMKTHANTLVNRTLPLTVRGENKIIMIQTDKPIYKPGETVMGRVIVLNSDMKSALGSVSVTIQNPKSYTMGQFSNITLDTGVGKFDFPLSSQPVLGMYKLCATYEGLPRGQRSCFDFNVQRYVLPRFSCSVTPTDEVVGCAPKKICFSLKATYTYGQKVKGVLTARVQSSNPWYRCGRGQQTLTTKVDGTADVCVDVCPRNRIICWGDMIIDANVTDPTSGTTVQCEGKTSVPVRSRPYKLTIVEEDRGFSPCYYSTVKVFASTVTGKPKYANVSLTGTLFTKNKNQCRENGRRLGPFYQLTDKRGMAAFVICMSCRSLQVVFVATVVGNDRHLFSPANSTRYMIYAPGRIVLSSSIRQLQVGDTANITASFSQANDAHYFVVNKGQILEHGRCLPKHDLNAYRKHSQLCRPGGIRNTCSISFTVTSSMAPKFTLVVNQKSVTASRIAFDVTQNDHNKVSLQFQDEEVSPGDKTVVTIRAPPASYIGVVAVDQSVYIQQEKNQLTTEKLYDQAARFDAHKSLRLKSYRCGWDVYWDCPCKCYGLYKPKEQEQCKEEPKGQFKGESKGQFKGAPKGQFKGGPKGQFNESVLRPASLKGDDGTTPPQTCGNRACCPRYCKKLVIRRRYCSYFKANSYFIASGLQLSNSDITPPEVCQKPNAPPKPAVKYDCCNPSFPLWKDGRVLALLSRGLLYAEIDTGHLSLGNDEFLVPSRVRQYFPETWLWFDRSLRNNQTSLSEEFTVPDTITSWVADAFALSPSTAMTLASPATLRAFKPFFISINLPYSVIRGELAEIKVTIFNYLDVKLTAFVALHVNADEVRLFQSKYDKTDLKQRSRIVKVAGGESKSLSYYLLPLKNGYLPIQATARLRSAADSVIRNLLVEPEGVKEEYSQASLICLNEDPSFSTFNVSSSDTQCWTRQFNVSLPPDFVPDSESAVASVTANYMGPTLDGLGSLLRMPTGCGEQNMLNFAPAVYIAHYLDTVDQLDSATRKKALYFMRTGYQKEMTYQREDGSYSAFGNSDRCGSMWLTAFVIRSFGQADGLIGMSIDQRVQQGAINFIVSKQNADGTFPPVCQPFNKEMQGCSGGSCTLTAYVTLALLEAGLSAQDERVMSALDYLSSNCITARCSSPYTLALVAYTWTRANANSRAAVRARKSLQKCAIVEGYYTYWQYTNAPVCEVRSPYCRTRSCDVETTAYALMAFVTAGDVAYCSSVARWLIEQRNPRGGFKSTQDTVVALQALSACAEVLLGSGCQAVTATFTAAQLSHTFTIDSSNAMQVQSVQLPQLPTVLDVSVCGNCCILASVGVKYNAPRPDSTASFVVSATATKAKRTCKYEVRICNRWIRNDSDSSNMAVTEITFFSGFLPLQSELKELQNAGTCQIKRTEFEGRVLSIYFDEVNKTQCCFDVTMKRASVVQNLQGVPVITYNYYEPDQRGGSMLYPRKQC